MGSVGHLFRFLFERVEFVVKGGGGGGEGKEGLPARPDKSELPFI